MLFHRLHDRPLSPGPLAEFAWEYLEAHSLVTAHLADYYSDQLAARLITLHRDRAFALLRTTILDERDGTRWNPLASGPQLAFWKELSRFDRGRALATLLDASHTEGTARWTISWHLPNLIDQVIDAPLLAEYAARGEREALIVCQAITGGRPGFWPLAFRLVNLYSASPILRRDLELRVEQMGQIILGPYSEHYGRCLAEVEEARRLPDLSGPVQAWLATFSARLSRAVEEQRRREADDRINRG
jgi:hypothetical protein